MLIYVSSKIPVKRLKPLTNFKTIEPLVLEVKLENSNAVLLGLYRLPRHFNQNYFSVLEHELNNLLSWITSLKQTIIITGDMNLNRLKPENKSGKLLRDLEEIHELECMIDQATRVTRTTQTLLDVILTNKADLFSCSGAVELGL